MMTCPVCKTVYDPYRGDCPTCGPIPTKPSGYYANTSVPDYSIPGVRERVDAECDYMADDDRRMKHE